ncbi:hypothetical protein, conserved [Leishmania tarentolae]|uniref:Uncharacterized protein n=1 Tax=Leishmania tarentolae TaxID=5689 RepID=A0A640KR50_LEITA|nr:hypothetical protein, conserved [Leishmania tarentolae]
MHAGKGQWMDAASVAGAGRAVFPFFFSFALLPVVASVIGPSSGAGSAVGGWAPRLSRHQLLSQQHPPTKQNSQTPLMFGPRCGLPANDTGRGRGRNQRLWNKEKTLPPPPTTAPVTLSLRTVCCSPFFCLCRRMPRMHHWRLHFSSPSFSSLSVHLWGGFTLQHSPYFESHDQQRSCACSGGCGVAGASLRARRHLLCVSLEASCRPVFMASHGEGRAQATDLQRGGTFDGAGVRAITTAVGRLLMDYAMQLREDLQSTDAMYSLSKTPWDVVDGNLVKAEEEGSSSAARSTAQTQQTMGSLHTADSDDEAVPLTAADMAVCRQRLQRLQRVKNLLAHFSGRVDHRGVHRGAVKTSFLTSGRTAEAYGEEDSAYPVSCETVRKNPVLMLALRHFDRIAQGFQGATASAAVAKMQSGGLHEAGTDASVSEAHKVNCIQPFLNPVPLAEGALKAFSRNVNIVFRRRPTTASSRATGKRPRDEPSNSAASSSASTAVGTGEPNYWDLLATQQRKRRFALYTARAALLPRVNAVCAPLYVSPAVQELAQLNAEAEGLMLKRAWCVHTKAHLLREVPWVARDVAAYRAALREALQSFTESQQDAFLIDVVYAEFVCADGGIVRVCVQHALFLDLTYDLRRRQWMLIGLQWNIFTTSAGASLLTSQTTLAVPQTQTPSASSASPDPLVSHSSTDGTVDSPLPPQEAYTPASFAKVVPQDREALHNFLQLAFAQDGLSGGLHAANRLVCAVMMDTFATQLQSLQQSFFTGGELGRLVEVEVRPGTLISFHLSLPDVFVPSAPMIHVKVTMTGGTVLLECVQGTDLSTRRVTLPLGTSSLVASTAVGVNTATRQPSMAVVDMEAFLWQCVRASVLS